METKSGVKGDRRDLWKDRASAVKSPVIYAVEAAPLVVAVVRVGVGMTKAHVTVLGLLVRSRDERRRTIHGLEDNRAALLVVVAADGDDDKLVDPIAAAIVVVVLCLFTAAAGELSIVSQVCRIPLIWRIRSWLYPSLLGSDRRARGRIVLVMEKRRGSILGRSIDGRLS
jgi:hypothetical protein